jgi:hypothetical protein
MWSAVEAPAVGAGPTDDGAGSAERAAGDAAGDELPAAGSGPADGAAPAVQSRRRAALRRRTRELVTREP